MMDERARKRKLEEFEESDIEGVEKELPRQGLKEVTEKTSKKQKIVNASEQSSQEPDLSQKSGAEKRRMKKDKKQQKKSASIEKLEKKNAKKAKAAEQALDLAEDDTKTPIASGNLAADVDMEEEEGARGDEIDGFEAEGLEEKVDVEHSSASPSSVPPSPTFDSNTEPSTNTSTSSVIPPATAPKHIKLPTDPELLRSRLAARIEALRAARKADGPDGAPARNRQELMEARRKKEDQRRAHKKELRLKAKMEDDARREAALASARDSPASSMMSPIIHSPEHNFSFGRVSFGDGQQLSDNLTSLLNAPKQKGPQDPASALQASEKKRLRMAGLDDEKRADIEEKRKD